VSLEVSRSNWEQLREVLTNNSTEFPVNSVRFASYRYQESLQESASVDDSLIIFRDGVPLACAVSARVMGRRSFFGVPVRIEFSASVRGLETSGEFSKLLLKNLIPDGDRVVETSIDLPVRADISVEILEGLMAHANSVSLYAEGSHDLDGDSGSLTSTFRKAHRQSIAKGARMLGEPRTICGEDPGTSFDEYRELHATVAGRVTRNAVSWAEMRQAIVEQRASLTCVYREGRLVGATFVWLSASSGYYGSGAYDRTLFSEIPISHLCLSTAMEHAKARGVQNFILGETLAPGATPKEVQIAFFKRGFANRNDFFHRLQLERPHP